MQLRQTVELPCVLYGVPGAAHPRTLKKVLLVCGNDRVTCGRELYISGVTGPPDTVAEHFFPSFSNVALLTAL